MKSKILYFVGGVVAGSAATFLVLRRRMSLRIATEVEEVKETYKEAKTRQNASESVSEETDPTVNVLTKNKFGKLEKETLTPKEIAAQNAQKKADLITNSNIINDNQYSINTTKTSYNLFSNPPKARDIHNGIDEGEDLDILDTTPPDDAPGPYVLEDDEFSRASQKFVNEEPYFDKVTLYFYNDGILCSEDNEIITNINETIGSDSLKRIGEYEPDVVYVRNEKQSTDYEVIRQYRDFAEIPLDDYE